MNIDINLSKRELLFGGLASLAISSSLYSIFQGNRLRKTNVILHKAVKDISSGIEIPEKLIEEAVDRAANKFTLSKMTKYESLVMNSAREEIRRAVSTEVNSQKASVKDKVKSELGRKIGELDVDDIVRSAKQECIDRAEKKVITNLESTINEITSNSIKRAKDLDDLIISKKLNELRGSSGISIKL